MKRIIGIDVGGTNTNAVYIEDGKLIAAATQPTFHHDLLSSARSVLEEIFDSIPQWENQDFELHLSTTLTTNAIIEGRGDPVAALVIPGPGMSTADLDFPFPIYAVQGAVDHRGRETAALNREEILAALGLVRERGVRALAVVGKFSVRNPRQELEIAALAQREFPELAPVTLGHRLSGRLNFYRRVITAGLNAGVARMQADFAEMVKELAGRYGIAEIFILKADGGTMRLAESLIRPVETTLSGPAASIMGALALGPPTDITAVTLDIGGTTTEIGVLIRGQALQERDGAFIAGHRTLIPALFSRSLGLGGDSRVSWQAGRIRIGPERGGAPLAMDGPHLTPTDAVIGLGKASFGDFQKARDGLARFGAAVGWSPEETAARIVDSFCEQAAAGIRETFEYVNGRPVYTVAEVMAPPDLHPEILIGMGGPAAFFIPQIAARMGMPFRVLPYAAVANAVGAAASRPTAAVHLRADTALGKLVVPELDEHTELRRAMLFDGRRAREAALEKAAAYAARIGVFPKSSELEIIDEEVFNVVRGFHTAGRIFSLQAQLKPGVTRVNLLESPD